MSMILDILVILTLVITLLLYTKRGFVKGALGLCGCLVAMILATLGQPILRPYLEAPIRALLAGDGEGSLSGVLGADFTVTTIASVISFFLLFLLILTAVKLLTFLLDRLFRLPVLSQANRLLGFLLGLCIGLIYAQILSLFLFTFSEVLVVTLGISEEAFTGSVVARWMFDHNLFRALADLL